MSSPTVLNVLRDIIQKTNKDEILFMVLVRDWLWNMAELNESIFKWVVYFYLNAELCVNLVIKEFNRFGVCMNSFGVVASVDSSNRMYQSFRELSAISVRKFNRKTCFDETFFF